MHTRSIHAHVCAHEQRAHTHMCTHARTCLHTLTHMHRQHGGGPWAAPAKAQPTLATCLRPDGSFQNLTSTRLCLR